MASTHSAELARALQEGHEEAVEVNQRSLIEKILARYSGEYTVFRELSQNADDAQASAVQIHFQTARQVPVTALTTEPITRIVIKNDGIVFRDEDWRRLKTIADGQPNVESIGAFGVGFYSIWSLSDQPLVVSGDNMMEFIWRGQQLAVRRAKNPTKATEISDNGRPWSSISMPCRDLEPMPDPASFSKFLATALPFTQHIRSMSLFFNEHELCRLSKLPAPSKPLSIPSHTNLRSPQRMMTITDIDSTPVQMTCRMMRVALASLDKQTKRQSQTVKQSFATKFLSFATSQRQPEPAPKAAQSPPVDPLETQSASLFLSIITASAKITATPAFIAEIERSTKKPPPTKTRLQVLFTSKDEADASSTGDNLVAASPKSIFASLASDVGTQGKIYIGFPLFQTTGCSSAVSARLIPTVEREQIDLNAKAIADYNRELLGLAGITCRILYDSEMAEIGKKLEHLGSTASSSSDDPARTWLESQASHLMQSFTYYQSTPIAEIGRIAQASFFSSNTKEFLLLSSKGILPASKVRLPAPELSFLGGLPTVMDQTAKENTLLLDHLQERKLLSTVTIDDVVKQLNEKALTAGQATSALQWWIGLSHNFIYDASLLPKFKDALIISITPEGDNESELIVPFSNIRYFLNAKIIPPDVPLPSTVLPYAISRAVPWTDLQRTFNLQELSIPEWLKHVTSRELLAHAEKSIALSPAFSEKVLTIVAKILPNLKPDQAAQSVAVLQPIACIPTRQGMKKPADSYSPKVTLFEDLPVTTIAAKGNMERLLKALGVRSHVDLQLVFSRLLGGGEWDQEQVAKYLVSVASSLSAEETDRLGKTAWLLKEGSSDAATDRPVRYKAKALYEPTEALRELELPIIAWSNSKWRSNSDEAKLLYGMGLRRHPDVEDVLQLASNEENPTKQKKALDYFLANFESQYATQYQPTKHNFAFVPVLKGTEKQYVKPLEAYTSTGANILKFATLHPEYQMQAAKFRLATDPKPADLVAALLAAPPKTKEEANPIFAYLAGQASRFTAAEHNNLGFARFIPAQAEEGGPYNLYAPRSVYFKSADSAIGEQFRSLFVFIDYPSTAANSFLLQVGVRAEPSIAEIAQLLLADAKRFLTLAGSADKYVSLLRQIAAQYGALPNAVRKKMQTAPFLLGFERVPTGNSDEPKAGGDPEIDDDDGLLTYRLGSAGELVVIDDTTLLTEFRQHILACPQDDIIESFVEQLGGKRLSKLVSTTYVSSSIPEKTSFRAAALRKLILERVALFLHERQQTSKDVTYNEDWLKKNLSVQEVSRIERQRVLTMGQSRFVKKSTAFAAATMEKGTLLLRISSTLEDDCYEIAAALTRLILSKQKIHDTLLFMTLLQTSLRDLKRRGFNVDRIVNARKAEQEAIEQKQREERSEADMWRIQQNAGTNGNGPPPYDDGGRRPDSVAEKTRSAINDTPSNPPTTSAKSLFSSLRSKLKGQNPLVPPGLSEVTAAESSAGSIRRDSIATPPAHGHTKAGSGVPDPKSQVTPTSNIATNVLQAVRASRPDRSGNITSEMNTEEVKESSGAYCDSTPANNLDYVTEVQGVRFYTSRDVDPAQNILQTYQDALRRFVGQIVKPVGKVYNVDPRALHVFYDAAGPTIAFNRSGSLFFNLRYHLAWHGEQVKNGSLTDALISVYFSMAHELAHNLVLPHNSEHAFYTSSIAQTFFMPMAAYIAQIADLPDGSLP